MRNNLEYQEKVLNLENENLRLTRQIRDFMDKNQNQYQVDKYYKDLEVEYMRLREKIQKLTDAKDAYMQEIRNAEID